MTIETSRLGFRKNIRQRSDLHSVNLNDRIEIQIIDTDDPTAPDERHLCDAALHEANRNARDRERFLKAKETYLRLKSEFEPE